MASKKAKKVDPEAKLISLEYNSGNQDLKFKSAKFIFNSPKLKEEKSTHTSINIEVDKGMITGARKILHRWIEGPNLKASPQDAFKVALKSGLGDFLSRYQKVQIYMELKPYTNYNKFKLVKSEWIWQIMSIGPGMTEVFMVYLDGEALTVLRSKRKHLFSLN